MVHVMTWQNLSTGDGNRMSSWGQAKPYLDFVTTDAGDSAAMHAAGLTVVFYSNPNRQGPGGPMYVDDETMFAHDCNNNRIDSLGVGDGKYLMDPHSTDLAGTWTTYVQRLLDNGSWFDFVFEDKADDIDKTSATPCNWNQTDWSTASNGLDTALTQKIIFNSLSHTSTVGGQPHVSPSFALIGTTAGGMSEDCYVKNNNEMRYKLSWEATELTEIDMAQAHKYFVCNGGMNLDGAANVTARIYQFASYVLTYDPSTTILETQFTTYSGLTVYPESQLVAKNPVLPQPNDPASLMQLGGSFGRQYKACYFHGNYVGPCAAVVNSNQPGRPAVPFPWSSTYHHTLLVAGGGMLDGGTANLNGPAPPATMESGTAVIAFP
jgi:hypothetical protein